MKLPLLALAALITAACASSPSAAAVTLKSEATQSMPIRFNDLNLSTEAGQSALVLRIKYRMQGMCGQPTDAGQLAGRVEATGLMGVKMRAFKACVASLKLVGADGPEWTAAFERAKAAM